MSASASAQSRRCAIFRFAIADGEFVVLLGPTGAGKTTTLAADRRAGAARRGQRS